jgi:hypothetical protein
MTTQAQLQANRKNALASTGPRTPAGKAVVAGNALRNGLRTEAPVVPGERVEDWEAHRAGIVGSLAPVGALEEELAGRVPLCLWRLRRVTGYETRVTAVGLDEVPDLVRDSMEFDELSDTEEALKRKRNAVAIGERSGRLLAQLSALAHDARVGGGDAYYALADVIGALPRGQRLDMWGESFLVKLGVPREALEEPYRWNGWTAGMVRRGVEILARLSKTDPARLLAVALAGRRRHQDVGKAKVKKLSRAAKELRGRVRAQEDRMRQRLVLPPADVLDKVMRYEAHLNRQMLQALHELQRLQAARAGAPVLPPAALDVTVEAGGPPLEATTRRGRAGNGFVR